jgi:hypothetical protein
MILAGLIIAAVIVAGLGLVLAHQTGVLGPLLSGADTLDSELKAERLAHEARQELAAARSRGEQDQP